jgi:hypothetical protein
MLHYETADDASFRLRHSIITLNGNPVFVQEVDVARSGDVGCCNLILTKLPSMEPMDPVDIADPGLADRGNLTLGYMNIPILGTVEHITRYPASHNKQGLTSSNLSSTHGIDFGNLMRQQHFTDLLTNNYPTLAECLVRLEGASSVAFSSKFALKRMDAGYIVLLFQTDEVGFIEGGTPVLGPRFTYLSQVLEEDLNHGNM